MKWLVVIMVFLFTFVSLQAEEPQQEPQKFGEALTLSDTISIARILANPEEFVGKRVLIKGTVADVCPKAGCWIDVVGTKPEEKIQVKVKDGVIVFPQSIKGKTAVVEGKVEKLVLDEEKARKFLAHEAEEKGETFNPESVKGPLTIYRIRGIGAEVQ